MLKFIQKSSTPFKIVTLFMVLSGLAARCFCLIEDRKAQAVYSLMPVLTWQVKGKDLWIQNTGPEGLSAMKRLLRPGREVVTSKNEMGETIISIKSGQYGNE